MLKTLLWLFLLSIVLSSCAAATLKTRVGKDVLSPKENISNINTIFSIIVKKDDTEIEGDGVLNISRNGNLNLRIYSLGVLAFELTYENGTIKSIPALKRNKAKILISGLRECFFWWDVKDVEIEEEGDTYIFKNPQKRMWIDRKTLLPIKQTVFLEHGQKADIYYEDMRNVNGRLYPSKINIEVAGYSVMLRIKDISFS